MQSTLAIIVADRPFVVQAAWELQRLAVDWGSAEAESRRWDSSPKSMWEKEQSRAQISTTLGAPHLTDIQTSSALLAVIISFFVLQK